MTLTSSIFRGLRAIEDATLPSLLTVFEKGRKLVEGRQNMIVKLSCGCMFGASAGMAILYQDSPKSRGLYYFATFVYVFSAITFSGLSHVEIARNSPYTLAGACLLVVILVLSPRFAFGQLILLMPFSIAMGLLVTVYVVPKIRRAFQEWKRLFLEQVTAITDGSRSWRSDAGTMDPDSIRSTGFRGNLEPHSILGRPDPLELAFMGRHYQVPAHLELINIDLELGLEQDEASSASSRESREPLL